ncbi:peptidyl-alpha-hydroxyglycine alpha-amidating lyase 1 isoform X2 [Apis mellifera]|uniref:peptidylamidoglycolate lyase n=1 Tax=Apis mellifera TaxID=7460 RepID=A0A7M7H1S0_APIME|nr:peptidyl-alpha-hydroxyglycine alpha-amidating lyase 1 isoform X2 [Apis mellifera]|eukprot:XP_006571394.1 peptidyl-alpha-hydroxyglycine alpha-amidating lyase 1 isoform X2 [Apis mellifera]
MHLQYDIGYCISILFILNFAKANSQNYQEKTIHLFNKKFNSNEYSDNDERDRESLASEDSEISVSDTFDKNIVWKSQWASNIKFGQISGVSIDPNGNIGIFHRGSRVWDRNTFDNTNRFDRNEGPIQEKTIVLLDKLGRKLLEWGENMFYLPHGLTIDMYGNYWITDVALHQVFKFEAKDIARMKDITKLKKRQYNTKIQKKMFLNNHNFDPLLKNNTLKPSMILGEAFEPGHDEKRFCKPTAVAVESNGDFFVSDGYCNSRIIKFNAKGEIILQWGRHWKMDGNTYDLTYLSSNVFNIPHALALASELNLLFLADRENGRVLSFFATNGTFHKEYKHSIIGERIYSVAYARERLYLVNGPDPNYKIRIRGFILDVNSGNITSQFGPRQDMNRPHDIAVSENGSEIYVVELNLRTAYQFFQDINTSMQIGNSIVHENPHHEPAPLTDRDINNLSGGCLLIMHKRMRWESDKRENFRLSNLLENRRCKNFKIMEKRPNPRDFSKLNTEPETSEDEYPENSFTKVIS